MKTQQQQQQQKLRNEKHSFKKGNNKLMQKGQKATEKKENKKLQNIISNWKNKNQSFMNTQLRSF